jgi:cytochrome c biogenesis protein CcdA
MKRIYIFLALVLTLSFITFNIYIKDVKALYTEGSENTSTEEITITSTNEFESNDEVKTLPVLGEVNIKNVSIPLIAILFGTIDGFNPCAMWVLLFLISMLLGMENKKRMWTLGITFLVTSALVYFVIMMSWITLATQFSTVLWLRNAIAVVAILGGFINIKSYMKKQDDGCEVVDDEKRSKIFDKVKKFTREKSFVLAMLGVIALAVTVNIIELACSAGFPVVFSQILIVNEVTQIQALMYTLLYILFFLIDDLIVFFIAMTTLKMTGISTKYGKYSHLIGGILMILIGALLLLKPEWIMFNF